MKKLSSFLLGCYLSQAVWALNPEAVKAADYADKHYRRAMVNTLSHLVSYPTYHRPGQANKTVQAFKDIKAYLALKAKQLGFDFKDYDEVVVIGFGKQNDKLGIVTHGDVQPADTSRWHQSPFQLDSSSEAGKLLGRGSEDDKGAIATALYAMKSIKDLHIPLHKRIELIISFTEESNWQPMREFVANNKVPSTNIVIDSSYPVVVAEKASCAIYSSIPALKQQQSNKPQIIHFSGGHFIAQVPETAKASLINIDEQLFKQIKQRAHEQSNMHYQFKRHGNQVEIIAIGKASHSASPQNGVNAITHLAKLLSFTPWPRTQAQLALNYVNQLIGTGYLGKSFGKIAYQHDFMGPMTVNLSTIKPQGKRLEIAINLRRPAGKSKQQLRREINLALAKWQQQNRVKLKNTIELKEAYYPQQANHADKLLQVFSYYTGITQPKAKSGSGMTHAQVMPNAVSFGPSMPNVHYSGHSEHEFITIKQLNLNLKMYTAAIVEIAS